MTSPLFPGKSPSTGRCSFVVISPEFIHTFSPSLANSSLTTSKTCRNVSNVASSGGFIYRACSAQRMPSPEMRWCWRGYGCDRRKGILIISFDRRSHLAARTSFRFRGQPSSVAESHDRKCQRKWRVRIETQRRRRLRQRRVEATCRGAPKRSCKRRIIGSEWEKSG
jgi:hypothetical protein